MYPKKYPKNEISQLNKVARRRATFGEGLKDADKLLSACKEARNISVPLILKFFLRENFVWQAFNLLFIHGYDFQITYLGWQLICR